MEFRFGVLLVVLAPKRAEDDFAPGVGFAFGVLGAGLESSQLGIDWSRFSRRILSRSVVVFRRSGVGL